MEIKSTVPTVIATVNATVMATVIATVMATVMATVIATVITTQYDKHLLAKEALPQLIRKSTFVAIKNKITINEKLSTPGLSENDSYRAFIQL